MRLEAWKRLARPLVQPGEPLIARKFTQPGTRHLVNYLPGPPNSGSDQVGTNFTDAALVVWVPTSEGLLVSADNLSQSSLFGFVEGHEKIDFHPGDPATLIAQHGTAIGWVERPELGPANGPEAFEGRDPEWDAKRAAKRFLEANNFQLNETCLRKTGEFLTNEFRGLFPNFEEDGTPLFGVSFGQYYRGVGKVGVVEILRVGGNYSIRIPKGEVFRGKDPFKLFLTGAVSFFWEQVRTRPGCGATLRSFIRNQPRVRDCTRQQGCELATETIKDAGRVSDEVLRGVYNGEPLRIGTKPSLRFSSGTEVTQEYWPVPL